VTFNGILGAAGIATTSRFGGLVELRSGRPLRFTELISYDGSTLDPLEIFIRGRMTSVRSAVVSGNGIIGASFREMPAAALPRAVEIFERMAAMGMGWPLVIGRPNQPLLDVPVPHGRVGFVVAGGLNPLAGVEEAGIETASHAMATLCGFRRLVSTRALKDLAGPAGSGRSKRRKKRPKKRAAS
jgi:repressor of nif and glnA expression